MTTSETKTIKLTKNEADLLLHRHEVADCIADHLADEFAENSAFEEAFWVAYDEVGEMLKDRELTIESPEQIEVVKELCDCSTWVAASVGETDAIENHARRVASSLEKKLAGIGIEVSIPRR